MSHQAIYPLLLPLLTGVLILIARPGGLRLQRSLALGSLLLLVTFALWNLGYALQNPAEVYTLGNWQAPFGIVLVLDQLSGLMILLTSLLGLAALWFAIRQKIDQQGEHFHTLFQIQLFGINGAFLTGDVFNLFVFFEVLLLASYGLLLHGGGRAKTRAGLHYVTLNLIGSTLFLFAVGTLYGILGTLNLADMTAKIITLTPEDQGVVVLAAFLLLIVFGIKAAMFPLYLWMPRAYANTTAPVAALFAIMTKVGIYAIIRVHGALFGEQAGELAGLHLPWLLWLGILTLIMAALGVLASRSLREQVAYLVLASVATLLIGLGISGQTALSASLYYLIHSTLIAGGFFLLADWIRQGRADYGDRLVRAYAMPKMVWIGSLYFFISVAIVGLPPLSGFFGKLLILSSAIEHPQFFTILGVILVSSLLMIIALAKTGTLIFYHTLHQEACHSADGSTSCKPVRVNFHGCASIFGLFSIAIIMVLFAGPIHQITDSVAKQTLDVEAYTEFVLQKSAIDNPYKELVE